MVLVLLENLQWNKQKKGCKTCLDKNDKSRCTSDFFIVTYVIPTQNFFVDPKTTGSILGFRGTICTFIWEIYFVFLATAEVSIDLLPKVVALFFHFSSII